MPKGSGTNSQGNHYNTPGGSNSSSGSSYHYSNSNGSYGIQVKGVDPIEEVKVTNTYEKVIEGEYFKSEKQEISKKSKRGKFRSLILSKDFEPAKNLQLEELTESTCKYMDGHPDDKESSFCGRKNVEKFSYCPLHLMVVFQPKGKKEDVIDKDEEMPKFIEKKIKSA